ncbi:tripartite tricarboxylate transporter substrate binding protein [Ramlibacter sp. XY19]|uniref:Bug family tripartite tricarboxylate transporter substrate binding protein n=1 Tax=Ramlibacter paludis TaxID=2908000 RepID=UPI0023DC1CBB|nr:tripartite tricarboxylate transporter substrate binding protein [Ramlibacter paludis]MCG2594350.1 tripartite tricarboxylate transporter substrate binding protein [Ramlibacter paludis]
MADSRISRRQFGALAAGAALASPLATLAQGTYPNRPIRLVVGLAAGGSLDGQARSVARRLTEIAGVQVIVDNKPGASMMLSASEVMRAPADGYTLLYAPSSVFAQNPHTLSSVPYDPFKDFTPITLAARGPLVLTVHQSLPVHTVKDLVAWAKANPGKLNFASFGTGTSSHIYAMAFAKAVGIEITHVPYKGTADAARDLLEGRVQAYFDAAPTAIQNAAGGRIRMIAVAAPKRMLAAPEVPTFTEQGVPGMDLTSWIAIVGPANMPRDIQMKANAMLVQALNSPDVKDFIAKGAYEASPTSPEDLMKEMHVAYDRWGQMVKQIGFEKQ